MNIHVGIVAYRPDIDSLITLLETQAGYTVWLFLTHRCPLIAWRYGKKFSTMGRTWGSAWPTIASPLPPDDGADMLLLLDQDSTRPPTWNTAARDL